MVGLAFLVLVPATYFFLNFSRESSEEITFYQFESIGRSIVDTSESLFYTGRGSKTIITITMPKGIESAAIIGKRELVFNISTSAGYSEFVFISQVNLTTAQACSQDSCAVLELGSSGVKDIRLTALNNSVMLEQVS